MLKKSILIAASAMLLTTSTPVLSQNLGNDLQNFWNRTGGGINVTRPQAYQGQAGGFVTMGSLYMRTRPRNANIAHIQLPSVRAGCGGIDIFGGSFSFISKEEMIYLMQAIMQNAAGFAFELALESLSPAIAEQVSKLRALLQEVNAMNINSCEAGQLLVGSLWPKMDGASQHICKTVGTMNSKFADRVAGRHDCGFGGKQNETLGEAQDALAQQVPININYAWRAAKKNGFLASNPRTAEIFMSMTGTIITTGAQNDNEGPQHRSIAPRAFTPEMLLALVDGGSVPILSCDTDDLCLNPTWQTTTLAHDQSYFSKVAEVVRDLSDAIRNDTALTPEMIGIIGLSSAPVYETLKTAQAYKYQFVDDEIILLAELVAVELAMAYMNETLTEMGRAASNLDVFGDIIREFQDNIRQTQNSFGLLRRQAAEKYSDAMSAVEKLQLHKALLSAGSSTKFASMMGQGR